MLKMGYRVLFAGLILATAVTDASATTIPTPEITPSSLTAGLALLAGGVLLVRARLRR